MFLIRLNCICTYNKQGEYKMRSRQDINNSVKAIFESYTQQFGGDGFADNDIPQVMKRTVSRRKVEFLDKAIDALGLTQLELDGWQKEEDDANNEKARQVFKDYLELKDYKMAEYMINNMRKVWSLEERKQKALLIGDEYDINPETDLVDTKHSIKKQAKKKA